MADKDEDTIEMDLSLPEEKVEKKEKAAAADPAGGQPPVEDALAALKAQLAEKDTKLAAADARIAAAENTARRASETVQQSQITAREANLGMVNSAIEAVKNETAILESRYAEAMAVQDYQAAAKIQTGMSTAAARLLQLETGKEAMEQEAKQPIRRVERSADPVEAFASQLSPRSAEWVRARPQVVTDSRLNQRMLAAHNLALTENLVADTDAYFERVEEIMGFRKAAEQEETDESALSSASQPAQRRAAPPAAPVTRSGTGNGKRPNTVTLSAEEREIASMNGMTDREYAEQKLKLQKEGKLH